MQIMLASVALLPALTASLLLPCATERTRRAGVARLSLADDGDRAGDDGDRAGDDKLSSSLWSSLRARVSELDEACESRWREAECTSSVALSLDDWIRRLALDSQGGWPLAAIGSAEGNLYIADLEKGEVVASKLKAHPQLLANGISELDMRLLHGAYDGGGLLALAFGGGRVVSAGRDGGARLWRYAKPIAEWPSAELTDCGTVDTGGAAVSSIALSGGEDGAIWCACLDHYVRRFELNGDGEIECTLTKRAAASCLSLAICEEEQLVVVATADGGVECLDLGDGSSRGVWRPLAFDGSSGYKGGSARSVTFATVKDRLCVVVGGSDGSLHMRSLRTSPRDESEGSGGDCFDTSRPGQKLLPPHGGQCVTLTPLEAGDSLLVSGAHDGTLRVWDLAAASSSSGEQEPKCLYGLGGYKVWLGSVCCDGQRLISDGRDNVIVVHDFSEEAARAVSARDEQEEP